MVRFRSGLVLDMSDVKETWGEFSEAAVMDVYGVRAASCEVIFDVGGNRGAFACFAAQVHPGAVVHTFEPQQEMAAELRSNVERNHLKNVV